MIIGKEDIIDKELKKYYYHSIIITMNILLTL